MADLPGLSISIGQYPNGKIRSIVADGTHWVTVSSANMSASIAAKQAREEILLNLKEQVEGLPHQYGCRAPATEYRWSCDCWHADVLAILNKPI